MREVAKRWAAPAAGLVVGGFLTFRVAGWLATELGEGPAMATWWGWTAVIALALAALVTVPGGPFQRAPGVRSTASRSRHLRATTYPHHHPRGEDHPRPRARGGHPERSHR